SDRRHYARIVGAPAAPVKELRSPLMQLLARLVVAWAVNVAALWVAVKLFDDVTSSGWRALIIAGLVFGIVNTFVKPVLILLSLPIVLLTLGLFLFFINMAMLALTDWLVSG